MDLSIRDAATLMGLSERAVRARLAHGRLAGFKRDGRWVIPRHALPLTDNQRRALHAKADTLRSAVEAALPPAVRQRPTLQLADLDAFRAARDLLGPIAEANPNAAACLRASLHAMAEGHFEYDLPLKAAALRRARARLAEAVAELHLRDDSDERELAGQLEQEVMPRLGGFVRWAETLATKSAS